MQKKKKKTSKLENNVKDERVMKEKDDEKFTILK